MAYIGTSPSNGVRRKHTYTATANQTSFSGNDDNGVSLVYVDTEYLDVYQNGVKLVAVSDYASTTGTSVVLTQGASVSDIIEIIVFDIFSVADTVSAGSGGNFAGNVGMGGTLSVTGETTLATHLNMGDSDIIKLGAGSDLTLKHDATNSLIQNSTGYLGLQSDTLYLQDKANGHAYLTAVADGAVGLRHDNAEKLATASTGVNVSGGIGLGGTGAVNILDDYEEGTAFINITDASGNAYSMYEQNGQYNRLTYTKIGRLVFFTIRIYTSSVSGVTGSDQARITGLPFTAIAGQPAGGAKFQAAYADMNTSSALVMGGMVNDNTTTLFLNKQDTDGTYSDLTITELGSARIEVMGMYHSA